MAINPTGAVPVPLTVFGGWCTEMLASTVPEGVSPDCADVAFLPGCVFSRPCLKRAAGGLSGQKIVYGKSFVLPSGAIRNLYLLTNGIMYVEDYTNNPGPTPELFHSTPGSYCKSVTAFGREWIAISDGLHATDNAYQYDGVNVDRVTQDGPGTAPKVASLTLPPVSTSGAGGVVYRVDLTAGGSGYTSGAQVYFAGGGGSGATAQATISGGTITALTLLSGGSGYSSVPSVVIQGNGTGVVTSLTLTNGGTGYTHGVQVTLTGGGGGGATVTAVVSPGSGVITSLVLNSGGSGYISAPTVNFIPNSPGFGSGAAATAGITGGATGTGATATAFVTGGGGTSLSRTNNVVTVNTTSPHGLQVGYQAQVSNVPAQQIATIASIVIANNDLPGEATITTTAPHGLSPGEDVTITGVLPSAVGGGIATAMREGQNTTIVTNSPHGLVPGAVVTVSISAKASFDGTFTVELVPDPLTIVYMQADADDSTTGGTLSITWPIPADTPTPTYFEVLSAPTVTTFTVQVNYTDGAWTTGNVQYAWNGIFYVQSIPSTTSFTYQQYGPNATSTAAGTVTPFGQCAPGLHLCQVLFQTRQGYITEPSPPVSFIANGGQYVSVSNIPIGPPNVVARILAFTGAQPNVPGVLPPFFYIPVPAQLEGQTVSTATQINDNTTTHALLDFSDNTLFAAISISVTGNTCANQIVLDGALGFSYFDSRLTTYGQRSKVQNLLNMGFDGGYLPSAPTLPTGWTPNITPASSQLVAGKNNIGQAWQFTEPMWITQRAYTDAYGAPILDGNTLYRVRFWCQASGLAGSTILQFFIQSGSAGFNIVAQFAASELPGAPGAWVEKDFAAPTPLNIPADTVFGIGSPNFSGSSIVVDDCTLFESNQQFLENQSFTSYVNNPEAYDGVTGNMQPTEDTHKLMDFSILRGTPYCHTHDPSGRLHEIILNPTSEPSGWGWKEVSANCGVLSAFCVTHSQADDQTASGGDDWLCWANEGGATIFDGAEPKKISQEIQPNWNEPFVANGVQINMAAATTIQALNDPVERVVYFLLPIGTATTPSLIYTLTYRELNSAYAIANSPPFHPSLSGKLVATDNTRKWTRWNLAMNSAARMYTGGKLQAVFLGGVSASGAYTLDSTRFTDDDYGQVNPYYITHAFIEPDKAVALGLTSSRIMLAYLTTLISGTGIVTYSYLSSVITNQWALSTTRTLSSAPMFDQEVGGAFAQGSRIFIKIASSPVTGTDNGFNLRRFEAWFRQAKLRIRGAAN